MNTENDSHGAAGNTADRVRTSLILIVEDSPVQTELLRRALEGAGYRVLVADNGAKGLVMAREHRPAAIITDINMPVMDGFAMSEAIRSDESLNSTPIIVLTMLSEAEDLIRGLNSGVDGYLTKPYDVSTLVSRLQALLDNPLRQPPATERRKVEVKLNGNRYLVDAHGPRILNLLLSTYQNAITQNRTLAETQAALEHLNRDLEQKVVQQTEALRSSERRFRSLIEHASDLVAVLDADGNLVYISPSIERLGGYEIAEVLGHPFVDYVTAGDRSDISAALAELVHSPGRPFESEFRFAHKNGHAVVLHAIVRSALTDPVIHGIVINARDITERKQADDQIKLQLKQLEASLMRTVEVANKLSCMRDPYTGSHARRVADLAVAIGAEMGFDKQRQQGLRVAGLLHDVGKIIVPSEILAKPGRISRIEMQLIQEHTSAGFELLKDVAFPWPVAEIALQHHERIDGSGYPQGLRDEEILLEARILAVADVVEAMSSHRPYRAGLGMAQALAEIERGRSHCYQEAAADACLTLFREQRYAFPD
jgi:PAS domain S-box-containing protein/putative nucleotidyltransferase with HDIG domain